MATVSGRVARSASALLPALRQAAERTGADFSALFHTARLESSFNPKARAATSSATGLFQFIEGTWLKTLARYGARHGLAPASRTEALALRNDPQAASLMAAEHMNENAGRLEKQLGRPATTTDLYLAHFLGASGAVNFLTQMARNPALAAADLLPAAAKANRAIFFDSGNPRSLAEVHALFERKLGGTVERAPARSSPSAPAPMPSPGLPPMLVQALLNEGIERPTKASGQTLDPRRAAQIAYLMLAELGG